MTPTIISRISSSHIGANGKPGFSGAAGANGNLQRPGAMGGVGRTGTAGVPGLALHSGAFVVTRGVFTGGAGGNGGAGGSGGNGSSGGAGGAAGAGASGGAALEVSGGTVAVTGGTFLGGLGGRGGLGGAGGSGIIGNGGAGGAGGGSAAPGYSFLVTGGTLMLKGSFMRMPAAPITTGTGTIVGTLAGNSKKTIYTYEVTHGSLVLVNALPKRGK